MKTEDFKVGKWYYTGEHINRYWQCSHVEPKLRCSMVLNSDGTQSQGPSGVSNYDYTNEAQEVSEDYIRTILGNTADKVLGKSIIYEIYG